MDVFIPVIFVGGTQSGLMRSHSLGRHEYNGERFGSRQTIQIQTRDKSAYGRIGKFVSSMASKPINVGWKIMYRIVIYPVFYEYKNVQFKIKTSFISPDIRV